MQKFQQLLIGAETINDFIKADGFCLYGDMISLIPEMIGPANQPEASQDQSREYRFHGFLPFMRSNILFVSLYKTISHCLWLTKNFLAEPFME
ncbi:hypothetical protein L0337_13905 [candidate division KSB1 bacterium]|nr:hypothetical protein [candidate division KSB1 bacterium]